MGPPARSSPRVTALTAAARQSNPGVDFEGLSWSPDGKHLSFMSDGSLGGVTGWQINIADIAADGTLTELHRLKLDPKSTDEHQPSWSPDGSKLAFLFEKDYRRQVGIFNADGSDFRLVGTVEVRFEHPRPHLGARRQDTANQRIPGKRVTPRCRTEGLVVDVATGAIPR